MATEAKIEDSASYPLSEFTRITGHGTHAIKEAEANGLKCTWVGNRKWISGREWNRYIADHAGRPRGKGNPDADHQQAGQ